MVGFEFVGGVTMLNKRHDLAKPLARLSGRSPQATISASVDERPQLEMLGVSSSQMGYNQAPNSSATLQVDM